MCIVMVMKTHSSPAASINNINSRTAPNAKEKICHIVVPQLWPSRIQIVMDLDPLLLSVGTMLQANNKNTIRTINMLMVLKPDEIII